jgi:hypothetical protein
MARHHHSMEWRRRNYRILCASALPCLVGVGITGLGVGSACPVGQVKGGAAHGRLMTKLGGQLADERRFLCGLCCWPGPLVPSLVPWPWPWAIAFTAFPIVFSSRQSRRRISGYTATAPLRTVLLPDNLPNFHHHYRLTALKALFFRIDARASWPYSRKAGSPGCKRPFLAPVTSHVCLIEIKSVVRRLRRATVQLLQPPERTCVHPAPTSNVDDVAPGSCYAVIGVGVWCGGIPAPPRAPSARRCQHRAAGGHRLTVLEYQVIRVLALHHRIGTTADASPKRTFCDVDCLWGWLALCLQLRFRRFQHPSQ